MAEKFGIRLADIDTNLLVALDAILREGSVSRAAIALSSSQPAVSHKLNRLRALLDDPLLVRQGRGLVPTPRARRLAEPLARALEQLGGVLTPPEEFDPDTATGVVHLACQYAAVSFVPTLVDALAERAPGLDVHALQLGGEEPQERLASGRSDIAIQPQSPAFTSVSRGQAHRLSESLYHQRLYPDPWVLIVREGHRLCDETVTPESFASWPHVLVSLRGDAYGFVDREIERLGLKRRIALLVQSFMLGCVQVARTDYVMTTNLSIALPMLELLPLRILPMPIAIPNGFVSQVWHERTHRDKAQAWIRKQIYQCGRQIEERVLAAAEDLSIAVT